MLVLLGLARLGGEGDAPGIRDIVRERTGRMLAPGALYTALNRLQQKGWVRGWIGDANPRGGRRRKRYRLERAGARSLARTYAQLLRMSEGLDRRMGELPRERG